MSLRDVSASLSTTGSKMTLSLVHKETGQVIQSFPVIPATEDHRSFIIATWLRSYRPHARRAGYEDLYDEYEPKIAESRWSDSLVVTDEDGFTVYAWVCIQDGCLYYAYVMPNLRGIGVTAALTEPVRELARAWPQSSAERSGHGFRRNRTLSRVRVNPYRLHPKETNGTETEVPQRSAEQ